ncbi:MAG: stage II sporulation protein E [Lachnospiraceae bacterium]|jgi:stage II sporulation protein E|nr:stage II sporulation protein E [Lachnospiraceae bacterium]
MKDSKKRALLIHVIGIFVARAAFYNMNPLAIGYFTAALIADTGSKAAFLTIALGIMTVMPVTRVLKYFLTMITTLVLLETPVMKKRKLPQTALYAIPAIMLGIYSSMEITAGSPIRHYFLLTMLEMVITVVSAGLFKSGIEFVLQSSKGYKMNNEQMVSMAVLMAVMIYAFPELPLSYVAPVETFVYFIILFFTYKYGVGQGAITGAVCGFALSLRGGQVSDTGLFTMMGILPAVFREMGKLPVAAVYLITAAMMGLVNPAMELSVYEIGALSSAVVVFLLLPRSLIYRVDAVGGIGRQEILAADNLKKIAKTRMKVFSDSFLKLSKTLDTITEKQIKLKQKEINRMFEDISEKLCKNCTNCTNCWENNLEETYQAACTLFEAAEKNGFIQKEDIPPKFLNDCIAVDEFVSETNRSFEIAKLNQIWQSRVAESREVIAEQLKEVSTVIQDITSDIYMAEQVSRMTEEKVMRRLKAEHILVKDITIFERGDKRKEVYLKAACRGGRVITAREAASVLGDALERRMRVSDASKSVISKNYENFIFVEDTKFKVLTGVARAMKENVSGDNFSILKLETGEMMVALADGMGTGKEAGEESETVMALLEQMIEAGFKAEMAIKLINSSLVLKSERQTFSTIDMSILNLFTGMCEFIKIGAASTFIKRENWVETISSTTLPIGMFGNVDYDTVAKKLYEGDIVIMVTDGVLDSITEEDKEGYMEKMIMEIKSSNPQEIANRILDGTLAKSNYVPRDDMTIITAGIWAK